MSIFIIVQLNKIFVLKNKVSKPCRVRDLDRKFNELTRKTELI
jgi:hypothetical protein